MIFEFKPVSYKDNLKKELIKAIGIGVLIFLIAAISSGEWLFSVPVGLLVSGVFFYKAKKWYRFNIEKVKIDLKIVLIYTEKGKSRSIYSTIDKIKIIKKLGISKGRVPYLIIKFNNSRDKIMQYGIGEWNEKKMDEIRSVVDRFKVRKP